MSLLKYQNVKPYPFILEKGNSGGFYCVRSTNSLELHPCMDVELGRNDTGNYHIHEKNDDVNIEGIVSRKGLADELSDRQFLIVENERGEIHYLEADHKTQGGISEIQEGVIIKLETEKESWLKPSDKTIADIARGNDNIYSPDIHKKAIDSEYIKISGKNIKTQAFIDAHKRRVQRLCRFGLAQDLGVRKTSCCLFTFNMGPTSLLRAQCHIMSVRPRASKNVIY